MGGFPGVLGFFGPFIEVFLDHRNKKKFRNLVLKKGQISGFAQIDNFLKSNFFWLIVYNFLQNHPNVKSWVCFEKFRKFAAGWAQEFLKLKGELSEIIDPKVGNPQN